ncbi:hypothetical protein HS088_TW16G00546 [Tripterygium wilfordii]|uniref:Uncharacterized protein n=1 Tax=Tripterygium wilfordii TaxID=458696 RepID=A0A7J7CJ87_TRIWF|nr:hypothetical protein HS088_TW16G00546 [Tripterygium wilfordii]
MEGSARSAEVELTPPRRPENPRKKIKRKKIVLRFQVPREGRFGKCLLTVTTIHFGTPTTISTKTSSALRYPTTLSPNPPPLISTKTTSSLT